MPDWTSYLDKGVIIKACFGPRGDWKPLRPAVVLTPKEKVLQCGGLMVVVGSRTSRDPASEVIVHPDAYTGLDAITHFCGDWQIMLPTDRVDEVAGDVQPSYMARILASLRGDPIMIGNRPQA